jgi:AcrR family transcriptional regulator
MRQQRSAETRAKILEAALELFRERGFPQSTMREIATRSGVATGLAYYYFASKDAIVLEFYQRALADLGPLLEPAQQHKKLEDRLQAILEAKFQYFAPNRRFLGALMSDAADPASPLSPFSEPSRPIREFDLAQFQRALDETGVSIPKDLAPHMAKILWMYQMGILLFWIYDRSEEQSRSRQLVKRSAGMVVLLLKLSNLPLLRPARKTVLDLVAILEG